MTSQDPMPRRSRITRFVRPASKQKSSDENTPSTRGATSPPPLLPALTYLYGLWLVVLVALGYLGADRWWWGTYNQYLPQWIWALPVFGLIGWCWRVYRPGLWLPLLLLLWVAVPVMDFRWSLRSASIEKIHGTPVRVLTYNVKNGRYGHTEMTQNIRDANADIVLLEQAHGTYKESLVEYLKGWNVQIADQYIFASRYPILESGLRDLSVGAVHLTALRCRLQIKERVVTVYSVHLLSPRSGLNALRNRSERFLERMLANNRVRQIQAVRLGQFLKQEFGPVILAGDLNAPVQSMIYDELTDSDLYNAFNEVGRGYGYTFGHISPVRHDYVRIDHIFLSRHWVALNCWTGSPLGSDHRPLLADLFLPDK